MKDYHVQQFPTAHHAYCDGKNCACAVTAMDVFFGSRGGREWTAKDVRDKSGISCVPGVDTPSGGINIPAIERICTIGGVRIDFGRASSSFYRRWTKTELRARLGSFYFGHILGQYSHLPAPWRAHGSTFQGGHSAGAHDLRNDLPDSHEAALAKQEGRKPRKSETVCWHDPLRPRPIRIPFQVLVNYNQAVGTTRGFVGWVKIPLPNIAGVVYANPMLDRTRTRYATTAVHDKRTKGAASTVRIIRGAGELQEIALYATGESYKGSTKWGATSLLADEWIHSKRLTYVGGET